MPQKYTLKSQLIKDDSYLYPLQFHIPDDIVQSLKNDKISRLLITINDQKAIQGSLISLGEKSYYIKINTSQMKKMSLQIGDIVNLKLIPDRSEYGMPLPAEFSAIWEIDHNANQHFHNLTRGKQRNLIYIVNSVKNLELRAHKAIIIMEHLNINDGNLDFKVLNASLKKN